MKALTDLTNVLSTQVRQAEQEALPPGSRRRGLGEGESAQTNL